MIVYYQPQGYSTRPEVDVESYLLQVERGPEDKIETSSEIVVYEAYRLYQERRIREFVLIANNTAWIADPDRVMRSWPYELDPEAVVLERLVS